MAMYCLNMLAIAMELASELRQAKPGKEESKDQTFRWSSAGGKKKPAR